MLNSWWIQTTSSLHITCLPLLAEARHIQCHFRWADLRQEPARLLVHPYLVVLYSAQHVQVDISEGGNSIKCDLSHCPGCTTLEFLGNQHQWLLNHLVLLTSLGFTLNLIISTHLRFRFPQHSYQVIIDQVKHSPPSPVRCTWLNNHERIRG